MSHWRAVLFELNKITAQEYEDGITKYSYAGQHDSLFETKMNWADSEHSCRESDQQSDSCRECLLSTQFIFVMVVV